MGKWLQNVSASAQDDFEPVILAYQHFEREYQEFRPQLAVEKLKGQRLIDVGTKIPGLSEWVYSMWAEVNAIIAILEVRHLAAIQKQRKTYTEGYQKALTERQVEHYAKSHDEVLAILELTAHMKYVRDLWEGLSRGVERLHYQIATIRDLRKASIEDTTI